MSKSSFLTTGEAARELGLSSPALSELTISGELKSITRRETGQTLIPAPALRAYRARLVGERPEIPARPPTPAPAAALRDFELQIGMRPSEWMRMWVAEELEDSAANMTLTIRALALLDHELALQEKLSPQLREAAGTATTRSGSPPERQLGVRT